MPALRPLSVTLSAVWPGVKVRLATEKYALVSRAARFTVTFEPCGRLRNTGIEVLAPRPTVSVSRPNEIAAGTVVLTTITAGFDVMAPLVAVTFAEPSATPVTTPVVAFTVAIGVLSEVYVNDPPVM